MIFIRLVDGGKNDDNRFKNAFKNIPDDKWSIFSDSNELPHKLYDDEDPINEDDIDYDSTSFNNAIILSTCYNILPIISFLLFTIAYV
jgi:hypothetical protein